MGRSDGELSTKRTQKTDAETSLANDEEFLGKLTKLCADKTAEYEDRKMMRANEEAAIAEGISILNSDSAFETAGRVGATDFLQMSRRTRRVSVREQVVHELTRQAKKSKSLKLARVAASLEVGSPFDKVVDELTKMIGIIAKEEAADDEQKAWCDSEREENHSQKSDKESTITTLNGQIESHLDTLDSDVDGLRKQLREEEESLAQ